MKLKAQRGRVAGRALSKQLNPDTPYDELFQITAWGEIEHELVELAQDYNKLMNQWTKIVEESQSLGNREREAYLKWVGLARGIKYDSRKIKNFGFTQEELSVGIKLDKNRDEAVYRLWLKERTWEDAHQKLNDRTVKVGGRVFLRAMESRDASHLRVLETIVRLVKRGENFIDPGLLMFILQVGETEDGKLNQGTPLSISILARGCNRDRKTIRGWCTQYNVTPTADKRGPRKKS